MNRLKPDKPRHQPKEGSKESALRAMRQRVIDEEIPSFCQAKNREAVPLKAKKLATAATIVTVDNLVVPKGGIDPDFAKTEAAKEKLRVLERKARKLEAKGNIALAAKLRAAKAALAATSPELMKIAAISAEPKAADAAVATAEVNAEAEPKESQVRKTKQTTKSKSRTAVNGKTSGVRPGSKVEIIAKLLKRPQGCTAAEVKKICDWPSVSMPQQAKAAGLKLKKEKVDGITRYHAA